MSGFLRKSSESFPNSSHLVRGIQEKRKPGMHPRQIPGRFQDTRLLLTQHDQGTEEISLPWQAGQRQPQSIPQASMWYREKQNAFHTPESNTDMGQGLKHPHLVFCIIGMVRKYESLERECICRGSAVRRRDNRIATGTKDQGIRQDVIHFGRCQHELMTKDKTLSVPTLMLWHRISPKISEEKSIEDPKPTKVQYLSLGRMTLKKIKWR